MSYLLDTHTLIWAIINDETLSVRAKQILLDANTPCYFSTASVWEITIKHSLDKLVIENWTLERIIETILDTGFYELPLKRQHFLKFAELPYHHRNPFDRILIAQAESENYKLISRDKQLTNYSINIVW